MPAEIAVIVPTFRRPQLLTRLIDALSAQTLGSHRWEVVVVDDCSGADAEPALADLPTRLEAPLRVLYTPRNGGPDKARNLGWRAVDAPLLAFCDDDVVPAPTWLEEGLEALAADERVGVLQGRTRMPDGIDGDTLSRWINRIVIDGPGPFFQTCNIFYRRAALEGVGGFTEEMVMLGNDSATGWSVVEAGWEHGFAGRALAVHDLEARGLRWFVRNGWHEASAVAVAAGHAGFRREAFWRPWAYRRSDAAFALAVASGLIGVRYKVALLAVLPWLYVDRPSRHDPRFVRVCLETVAIDVARLAGHLTGSVRNRIFVV